MTLSTSLMQSRVSDDSSRAQLTIHADRPSPHMISPFLRGKFCEHLVWNIANGMHAQILRNPTMADFPFGAGSHTPDGRLHLLTSQTAIAASIRQGAAEFGCPEAEIERVVEAYFDSLACWWMREGDREAVRLSPDTGPYGTRAQRVEMRQPGTGIAQWSYLPLHRVRSFEYQMMIRSPELTKLTLALYLEGKTDPVAVTKVEGLTGAWGKIAGTIDLPGDVPDDARYRVVLMSEVPGQFVIERFLLFPADHINGADPEVLQWLREFQLPVLRWPGGNFVSSYHWEDGVGPVEARPTRMNPAWGMAEPNFFGTDEYIAYCRAIGCEPMICVNGGDGTPQEAANWIEYCNGPADSPMGARRAANGHPEPYHVRFWEIGNELYGFWQVHWTTPNGYADRYQQFATAMLAVDPTITLLACAMPVMWGNEWYDTLLSKAASSMGIMTDHILEGDTLPSTTDPLDIYRDLLAFPVYYERRYAEVREAMEKANIPNPRLAITELQLFAFFAVDRSGDAVNAHRAWTPINPMSLAEGLYDTLFYHMAVRLAPFLTMITHSATVNHGGGLKKTRERVYAEPCHYAQLMLTPFSGATPLALELTSPVEPPAYISPSWRGVRLQDDVYAIDPLAARAEDGSLLISLIHRGTQGPIALTIDIPGFADADTAEVCTLSADVPWVENSLAAPEAVRPVETTIPIKGGRITIEIKPYTIMRLRIPLR